MVERNAEERDRLRYGYETYINVTDTNQMNNHAEVCDPRIPGPACRRSGKAGYLDDGGESGRSGYPLSG